MAGVSCLFAVISESWPGGGSQVAKELAGRSAKIAVGRNCLAASVTIEDGFGFEAVVPVKSPT